MNKYRIIYDIDFTGEPKFDFTIEQIKENNDRTAELFDTEELAAKEALRKIKWETSWAENTIKNLIAQNKAREAAQKKLTTLYPSLL